MAGLLAQLIVINTIGSQTAVLYHIWLTADNWLLGSIGNRYQSRNCRSNYIVSWLPENINLAHQTLSSLLNIIYIGNGSRLNFQALGLSIFLHSFELNLRIGLAGGIDTTNGLSIWCNLQQQINLLLDRIHIAGTSQIAAWLIIAFNQLGTFIVSNSRSYNRNILGKIGYSLSCRCSNGINQINLVINKTLTDILQIGLVGLSILLVNYQILALLKATLLKTIYKALVGSIQSIVLYQLNNAYLVLLVARVVSRLVRAAAS